MATFVVHPGGWSRWSRLALVVGPTSPSRAGGANLTPETLFWGTPRVGQGLTRFGLFSPSAAGGPLRGGLFLVWSTPVNFRPGENLLEVWLVQVGKLLGYF